jgi:hypothetical protein
MHTYIHTYIHTRSENLFIEIEDVKNKNIHTYIHTYIHAKRILVVAIENVKNKKCKN